MKTDRWKSINISSTPYQSRILSVPAPYLLRIKVPLSEEGTEQVRSRYGADTERVQYILFAN